MLLHRIHLDPRCREARRDLSDPYQMHSTLCRAFSTPSLKCPEGEFLWRLEPETGPGNLPRLLVQSRSLPDWARINVPDWSVMNEPAIDLRQRLRIQSLIAGQRFRFRLRANPSVTRNHRRVGLLQLPEQQAWLVRKGELHGFTLQLPLAQDGREVAGTGIDVLVSQQQMLRGRQHAGNGFRVYSV
ncbi:MAG: CRISPR-associated protein Cse3 family, partial [Akkermansiaceae bacterium]|nr:CRISPR-associated protein Cse3 family [Akkermansiaceae bacterium]